MRFFRRELVVPVAVLTGARGDIMFYVFAGKFVSKYVFILEVGNCINSIAMRTIDGSRRLPPSNRPTAFDDPL